MFISLLLRMNPYQPGLYTSSEKMALTDCKVDIAGFRILSTLQEHYSVVRS